MKIKTISNQIHLDCKLTKGEYRAKQQINNANCIIDQTGLDIVTCGECGDVNIVDVAKEVQECYSCGYTSESCDFPSLFFDGMIVKREVPDLDEISKAKEDLESYGNQLAKIDENALCKAEEKQKIVDWYIDDFKGLKGDTTGLSDTMEELINALSDSAFKHHIKDTYIDVMNDMDRDRQIERMKHRMRLVIDDATALLNLFEKGYSLDEVAPEIDDHLWYLFNNIQEVVESNVNKDCEVDHWKVRT